MIAKFVSPIKELDRVSSVHRPSFTSAKMSGEPHDDSAEQETNESQQLSIQVIVFLLILILVILEKINHKEDGSSNGKRTNRLMIGVIIVNSVFTLCWISYKTVCIHCPVQYVLMVDTRWVMRWFNWQFLIHRAKLAQGMTPILSKKWFTKIFPGIITFVIVLFFFISIPSGLQKETTCETYKSIDIDVQQCALAYNGINDALKAIAIFFFGFDLVITVFLLTLFVVPLYRVYSTDLGVLNANQLRQRCKLRTLLIWSVTMCLINQITSTLLALPVLGDTRVIWVLVDIARFDPAINVWTSWLMITRNRQYLRKVLQCSCCLSKQTQSQRISMQSTLSDVSDKESHSRAHRFSRLFTRKQSRISMRSVNDLQLVVEEEPDVQHGTV